MAQNNRSQNWLFKNINLGNSFYCSVVHTRKKNVEMKLKTHELEDLSREKENAKWLCLKRASNKESSSALKHIFSTNSKNRLRVCECAFLSFFLFQVNKSATSWKCWIFSPFRIHEWFKEKKLQCAFLFILFLTRLSSE